MIAVLLRDLLPRLALLALLALALFFADPAFHRHGPADPALAAELGPLGVSASLAYLASLAMIVLLAGFVSTDRREGYARLFFSHPTHPLAYYGLRWALAWALSVGAAALFLVLGQWAAWGEWRGGAGGLLLAALAATMFGGIMALLSALLPRGDAWVALLLFVPVLLPELLFGLQLALPDGLYRALLLLLPQTTLQTVYQGLLLGAPQAGPVLFAAGYGVAGLLAAALVLEVREWI